MDGNEIDNIIHAGTFFVVYLFVMIALFFFLSGPVSTILTGIGTAVENTPTQIYMDRYLPSIDRAVWMVFAIGASVPMTWFIFWVFSRDPFQGLMRIR